MPWTMSSMAFFNNQVQITPKWLVWSGQNSISSKILCLIWLPASLTNIRSKNERAGVETSFFHYTTIFFHCSRARNTEVNNPIRLEIELIWDVRPVLDTCKFGKDPIKNDWEKVEIPFSSLYVNVSFWLPWQPHSLSNLPETKCSRSTTPWMLHIKFDQNW